MNRLIVKKIAALQDFKPWVTDLQYQSHRYSLEENKEPFIAAQPRLLEMGEKPLQPHYI